MRANEVFKIPEEKVFRTKPIRIDEDDNYLFEVEYSKVLPEVSVIFESNGLILPSGYLLNGILLNNKQFNISPGFRGKIFSYIKSLLSIFSIRKIVLYEKAFFITNPNSINFFHWFLDVLQKIEYLEKNIKKEPDSKFLLLIPANHNLEFMKISLSAFNIECNWIPKNELALVNKIAVIPDVAPTGNYRQKTIIDLGERLRSYFKNHITIDNYSYSTSLKLYITRKNAQKRKIINEKEIIPILIEFGFTVVDFDTLSFAEQVSYVINTEVLLSLHGAALTHMLWMKPQGKVVEIRARNDSQNNCYFSLASNLGYEYHYVLVDKTDSGKTTQLTDFIIDKNHFREQISKLEGQPT